MESYCIIFCPPDDGDVGIVSNGMYDRILSGEIINFFEIR